jgi:hypothetical protein
MDDDGEESVFFSSSCSFFWVRNVCAAAEEKDVKD